MKASLWLLLVVVVTQAGFSAAACCRLCPDTFYSKVAHKMNLARKIEEEPDVNSILGELTVPGNPAILPPDDSSLEEMPDSLIELSARTSPLVEQQLSGSSFLELFMAAKFQPDGNCCEICPEKNNAFYQVDAFKLTSLAGSMPGATWKGQPLSLKKKCEKGEDGKIKCESIPAPELDETPCCKFCPFGCPNLMHRAWVTMSDNVRSNAYLSWKGGLYYRAGRGEANPTPAPQALLQMQSHVHAAARTFTRTLAAARGRGRGAQRQGQRGLSREDGDAPADAAAASGDAAGAPRSANGAPGSLSMKPSAADEENAREDPHYTPSFQPPRTSVDWQKCEAPSTEGCCNNCHRAAAWSHEEMNPSYKWMLRMGKLRRQHRLALARRRGVFEPPSQQEQHQERQDRELQTKMDYFAYLPRAEQAQILRDWYGQGPADPEAREFPERGRFNFQAGFADADLQHGSNIGAAGQSAQYNRGNVADAH